MTKAAGFRIRRPCFLQPPSRAAAVCRAGHAGPVAIGAARIRAPACAPSAPTLHAADLPAKPPFGSLFPLLATPQTP